MVSKKYKQQREKYIFNNLPSDEDDDKCEAVLSESLLNVLPLEVLELVA